MEHVTVKVISDKQAMLVPDKGYVLYNTVSQTCYSNVVTDQRKVGQFKAVEEGSEPSPTPVPPTPADLLERAKQMKVAEISAYDRSDHVNVFYLNGMAMWLTVSERQQIATQISASEAVGRETMSRWFGGHEFTFPLSTWKQMLVALEVYAGDAINVTEAHKAAVEALESVEAVEAYDITQGYPAIPSF